MSNLSIFTKNGQSFQVGSGSAAIAQGDFIEVGGPGNEAYSVTTMDYAIPSTGVAYNVEQSVSVKAMPGSERQYAVRDRQANIYTLGLNSSGNLTVTKVSPQGFGLPGTILDGGTSNAFTAKLLALSNGTFAAVYARTGGALFFVIFDASLNITTAPTAIANEYFTGSNVVYHDSVEFAGGGFGVVYQLAITGTQILLQTYSNAGAGVLTATNIQTLSGTLAQATLKVRQLPNGNLVTAIRNTMTPVGTSFVITDTSGVSVKANTVVDSSSSLGLVEINFLAATGAFAIAVANGTNLICGVFNQAGVVQGANFSTADTLNSVAFPQTRLSNDGAKFWLIYLGSANTGINIVQIPVLGTGFVSTTGLVAGTISSGNWAIDAMVCNGLLAVFAASTGTAGQVWMTFGLPDGSIGTAIPYVRTPPIFFGTSAATTGSHWPKLLNAGDWVGLFIYDRVAAQATLFSIQKIERSSLLGISQTAIAAGNPGSLVTINPGPGTYPTGNAALSGGSMIGTAGLQFAQGSSPPFGNIGTLYPNGVTMMGIASTPGPQVALNTYQLTGVFGSGQFTTWSTPGTYLFTATTNLIRVRVVGSGQSGGPSPGDGGTTSFGTIISATGGTAGSGAGIGVGGQFQASGGAPGTGSGHAGGGGGGAGSVLGPGGPGGNSAGNNGGGGGGIGGNAGGTAATGAGGYAGAGGGSLTAANGPSPGAATDGSVSYVDGVLPMGFVTRFPFDTFGGSGGGTINKGSDLPGSNGAIGGGGAGGFSFSGTVNGGNGGVGGGGGGGGGAAASGAGGAGGLGGGGGGSGAAGGYGGGFAIGVFPTTPGTVYTVIIAAGGVPGSTGGRGGPGSATVEW